MTFRPEFTAPWTGHAGVTSITLSRLKPGKAAMLSEQLVARPGLPETLLDRIVAQSDGVPLFIEELTKRSWRPARRQARRQRPFPFRRRCRRRCWPV